MASTEQDMRRRSGTGIRQEYRDFEQYVNVRIVAKYGV
jgi:hypothetical protein